MLTKVRKVHLAEPTDITKMLYEKFRTGKICYYQQIQHAIK